MRKNSMVSRTIGHARFSYYMNMLFIEKSQLFEKQTNKENFIEKILDNESIVIIFSQSCVMVIKAIKFTYLVLHQ